MMQIEELKQKVITGEYRVFTDSRVSFSAKHIFVGLIGEKHDAGQYVPSLLSKNLSYAVVEDNSVNRALLQDKKNVFFVVDSTRFLQDLAHAKLTYWRQQNGERKVLALTGSNGKTTTKEMLAWLLKAYPKLVHVTKGNLNNHLGVPFTILDMPLESEVLVLEMGTNHPGEIELLCQIAPPDAGLITNIGQSHLEFFHNEDNVMVEKSALYHAIAKQKNGFFLVNCTDKRLKQLDSQPYTKTFGNSGDFIYQSSISGFNLKGTVDLEFVTPHIPEAHNRQNMAMALSLCVGLWPQLQKEFSSQVLNYRSPRNNRSMLLTHDSGVYYLDAYNANPSSMLASLKGFIEWWQQNKKGLVQQIWFILGDMNELGDLAPKYHEELGRSLANFGAKRVTFIGRYAQHYLKGFGAGEVFADRHEFLGHYGKAPRAWHHEAVFIKGSRTLQLEELIDITVFSDF